MNENITIEQIEERLDKLRTLAKKDCVFDKNKVETNFDNIMKISKWIDKKQEWIRIRRIMATLVTKRRRKLWTYYKTEYNVAIDTAAEMNLLIESDEDFVDLQQKFVLVSDIIKFIDATIDNLKSIQWDRKAWIDYQTFIHGK
jgi:hypothetical protein